MIDTSGRRHPARALPRWRVRDEVSHLSIKFEFNGFFKLLAPNFGDDPPPGSRDGRPRGWRGEASGHEPPCPPGDLADFGRFSRGGLQGGRRAGRVLPDDGGLEPPALPSLPRDAPGEEASRVQRRARPYPLAPSCLGRLLPILETPRRAGAPREKLPLRKTLNGFGCLPPCARPSELEEGGLRGVFFETRAAPSLFSPCGRVSGLERQVGQWEAVSVDNP